MGRLLAEHRKAQAAVQDEIVLLGARRPEAVHAACLERLVGDELIEQVVRGREELPRGLALLGVVEDRGEAAP